MKTTMTMPGGRMEQDMRYWVTLEPEELPWPIRFAFLYDIDGVWQNVSFEMGVGPVPRSAFGDEGLVVEELKPSAVRWLQENFFHYRAIAESHLNTDRKIPSKSGSRVSPEALAFIAAEYRKLGGQRGAVAHLAKVHNVSRTTIWRWLKRAGVIQTPKRREPS